MATRLVEVPGGETMGLFSRKETIGEMVTYHYPNREMVFSSTLNPRMTYFAYGLTLGKHVYDMGSDRGGQLWQRIFFLASDAFENVVQAESDTPLDHRQYESDTPFHVVSSSNASNPLKETAKIVQKGGLFFCETFTSPLAHPNAEEIVADGMETLFVHLFNSGDRETKFFLPVLLLAQCNWYQDNGHPSISTLNHAAYTGIGAVQQLAAQM